MPNHITRIATSVEKLTAPDDFSPQIKTFNTKKMLNMTVGKNIDVYNAFARQDGFSI